MFLIRAGLVLDGVVRPFLLDIALVALVVLIILAFKRDRDLKETHEDSAVVSSQDGLEPFHLVTPSDIYHDCKTKSPLSPQRAAALAGRYPFTHLSQCESLEPSKLSSRPLRQADLANRVLIRLKVQPTALFDGMKPPYKADFMLSPRERGTSALLLQDVLILDFKKASDETFIVAAIHAADESLLASFASRSDIFLIASAR